jgi:hypothetical protein
MVVAGCDARNGISAVQIESFLVGRQRAAGWALGHERRSPAGMYDNGRMFYLIFRNANNSNASTTRQTLVKRQVAVTGW